MECLEPNDKCANCAGYHRTSSCRESDKSCVSCKSNDHASWSRKCPTFLRKLDEFNSRNPDNSLQFYPTVESWTWTATERVHHPASAPPLHQSYVQLGKNTQPAQQVARTHTSLTSSGQNDDWGADPGPSNSGPPNLTALRPGNSGVSPSPNLNRPVNPPQHINV